MQCHLFVTTSIAFYMVVHVICLHDIFIKHRCMMPTLLTIWI